MRKFAMLFAAGTLFAAKNPVVTAPPTQPDLIAGCVSATEIHSLPATLESVVVNGCNTAETAFFRVAYFDDTGEQYGDGIDQMTLAAGATRRLRHTPPRPPAGHRFKSAQIIVFRSAVAE